MMILNEIIYTHEDFEKSEEVGTNRPNELQLLGPVMKHQGSQAMLAKQSIANSEQHFWQGAFLTSHRLRFLKSNLVATA